MVSSLITDKKEMVIINENDDIYSLIRQNNTYAVRLWLDNVTNDIHQWYNSIFLIFVLDFSLI